MACLFEEGQRKGFCRDVIRVVLEQGASHEPDCVQLLVLPFNTLRSRDLLIDKGMYKRNLEDLNALQQIFNSFPCLLRELDSLWAISCSKRASFRMWRADLAEQGENAALPVVCAELHWRLGCLAGAPLPGHPPRAGGPVHPADHDPWSDPIPVNLWGFAPSLYFLLFSYSLWVSRTRIWDFLSMIWQAPTAGNIHDLRADDCLDPHEGSCLSFTCYVRFAPLNCDLWTPSKEHLHIPRHSSDYQLLCP